MSRIPVLFCLVSVLLAALPAFGKNAVDENALSFLNPGAVRATSRITYDIFKSCPPKDCLILSLGRAGSLMDSFLRVRSRMSGFEGQYVFEVPYVKLIDLPHGINGEGYLASLVPSEEVRAGRQVVLLRSLYMGYSIAHVLPRIVERLAMTIPLEMLGAIFVVTDRGVARMVNQTATEVGLGGLRKTFVNRVIFRNFVQRMFEKNQYTTEIENYHRFLPVLGFEPRSLPISFVENPSYMILDASVDSYLRANAVPFGQSVARIRNWCELHLAGVSNLLYRLGY